MLRKNLRKQLRELKLILSLGRLFRGSTKQPAKNILVLRQHSKLFLGLTVCDNDIMNYNDATSATNSYDCKNCFY